ncbi:DUF3617 domain-containing protein [Dyella nitratireducens]|uniref:DUF3617 family protein n=1 Tax=Dyella nitratireducens TaxID=1849580 RepID=A0ABQ1FW39_9GAMM|nr:hypothetical protein [Dyella nitratireducens]GGA31430.1 hypothetical protein GCM10010981_20660 [Dyella nitratireducens]GLQ42871.1 hypothetical protein GCM10007902_27210 [Dyella nitratireducens]
MSLLARSTGYLSRWSNPVAALVLMSASAAISNGAHADPADFQAMPGLWKITLHTLKDGKDQVKWKCLYDGGDPWTTFVDSMAPATNCQRSNEHRTSTALAWKVNCSEHAGNGHITLDAPDHYTGSVKLEGHDVLQIEGKRYAACTSPSD